MKRIISIILLISMLLGVLASCSGGEKKSEVSKIAFEEENITIKVGETVKLEPKIYPKSARDAELEWESSNEDVATVNKGKVKGISEGTTIIAATAENGESAICRVNVVENGEGGNVNPENPEYKHFKTVLPEGEDYSAVDLSNYNLPATVKNVYRETNGIGYVVKVETKGYSGGLVILVGVSDDYIVTGATFISSNETNGVEKTYGDNFVGKDITSAGEVDLMAGSTLTTNAYRNAVIDAINAAAIVSGLEIDLRTEEEKFADALSAALPESDGSFTKLFIFEYIGIIDMIYEANNGAGYVCVIGHNSEGEFIGIDSNGNVVNPKGTTNEAHAQIAVARIVTSELSDVDITEYKNHSDSDIRKIFRNINYVKKSTSGCYVLEIETDNQYNSYTPTPIVLRIAIDFNGYILDIQTVSHSETPSFGGAQLEDGAYNSCFIGFSQSQSEMVDTVAGVTITTGAFKKAILNAFRAVDLIKAEENAPKEYTLGLGIVYGDITSSQINATIATVVLDKNGKIVACKLDAVQNKFACTADGIVYTNLLTKKELGDNYGMAPAINYGMDWNGDGIVKEWFEQAEAFEAWCVGKTIAEVEAMDLQTMSNGYIISADYDLLNAGCTIQITDFVAAVVKAGNDDQATTFTTDGEITLGLGINSSDNGSSGDDFEATVKMNIDYAAVVTVDRVIVAALNDGAQPQVVIEDGEVVYNSVLPHEHNFVDGKCKCGEKDPNYVPSNDNEYTLGMGIVFGDITNSQINATIATVVLDENGKIAACKIDAVQNKYSITADGVNFTNLLTKKELGYNYNMAAYGQDHNGDGIVKEWFEQAAAFEAWCVGKTIAEVEAMELQTMSNGYIISADYALLNAGCTIQITDFINAVVKAGNDEQATTFTTEGEITLGLGINSYDNGSSGDDFEATVKMNIDYAAVVTVDRIIVAALNDGAQPQATIEDGEVISTAKLISKRELKDSYNMAAYGPDNNGDGIVKEWYLQSAEFSKYVVGLTSTEVANLETQFVNGSYISADNTLLNAGCTMQITGIMEVVVIATNNAI